MLVSKLEYEDTKQEFFHKHHNDFQVDTVGSSAEHYTKTYTFADGAIWYEYMTKETVEEIIEVKMCKVKVSVDMMKIEYGSNFGHISNYCYEPWNITQYGL